MSRAGREKNFHITINFSKQLFLKAAILRTWPWYIATVTQTLMKSYNTFQAGQCFQFMNWPWYLHWMPKYWLNLKAFLAVARQICLNSQWLHETLSAMHTKGTLHMSKTRVIAFKTGGASTKIIIKNVNYLRKYIKMHIKWHDAGGKKFFILLSTSQNNHF